MANLLDQKTEVINVELTKHGKKLLSQGLLEPSSYLFFDDNILYDHFYADVRAEKQNNIQDRILNNSLSIGSINLLKDTLFEPLGDSSPFSDYAPAWELKVLNGKIKTFNSSSSDYYQKNIELKDITYNLTLKKNNTLLFSNTSTSEYAFKDEIIAVQDDYILIDLKELNVADGSANFEIELITYDDLSGPESEDTEEKLLFLEKQTNIIDGIIYEDNELPNRFNDIKLTTSDVLYFYDILVDDEIDITLINKVGKTIQEQADELYKTVFEAPSPVGPEC